MCQAAEIVATLDVPSKPPQQSLQARNTIFWEMELRYLLRFQISLFTRWHGVSIGRCMRRKGLERAKELLRSGASVSDAAEQAGFKSASGFCRAFQREFGVTAAAFRENREKQNSGQA